MRGWEGKNSTIAKQTQEHKWLFNVSEQLELYKGQALSLTPATSLSNVTLVNKLYSIVLYLF